MPRGCGHVACPRVFPKAKRSSCLTLGMPRAFPGPQSCGYGCEIRLGQEVLLSFSPPSCVLTLSTREFDLPLLVASGQSPVLGAAPCPGILLLPSLTQERALQLCCKMQTPCLESPAHKSSLPLPCSSLSLLPSFLQSVSSFPSWKEQKEML